MATSSGSIILQVRDGRISFKSDIESGGLKEHKHMFVYTLYIYLVRVRYYTAWEF